MLIESPFLILSESELIFSNSRNIQSLTFVDVSKKSPVIVGLSNQWYFDEGILSFLIDKIAVERFRNE